MRIVHIIADLNVGGAEMMLKRIVLSHKKKLEITHIVISLMEIGIIGKELI